MAEVVHRVNRPHPCRDEIAALEAAEPPLDIGTVVKCSCGKKFVKREDQREGFFWDAVPPDLVGGG
jgi:hypothetical protein